MDECAENPCHPAATCYNTPGSFSCRCQPGYEGDGFQCTHGKAARLAVTPALPEVASPILTLLLLWLSRQRKGARSG